jgi:protein O-GlcNAc transferase
MWARSMTDQGDSAERERALLLACAKIATTQEDELMIRRTLGGGVDWVRLVEQAVERGVASQVGQTLRRIAPDLLPDEILGAFSTLVDRTRQENSSLLEQLAKVPGRIVKDLHTFATRKLAENPNNAAPWLHLGKALHNAKRYKEAIACFDRAIALAPGEAAGWRDRGIALLAVGERTAALTYLDKALALDREDALAWTFRAHALVALERFADAAEASDRALTLDPGNVSAARVNKHALLFVCEWSRRDEVVRAVRDGVSAGQPIVTPFLHLAISDSEEENFAVAKIWAQGVPSPEPLWRGERYCHDRIRIAYISTDFRDTLSVNAIAGGFESHDKTRFEMTAISLRPSDGSDTRRRIEAAFDRFIDAQNMSDAEVARLLREAEIDIAIDLNGYAGDRRTGILAHRPAPIQVNYLGFAGTMGMPCFDYILADRTVIPPEHHRYYSEKVVYLPQTFFPTDRRRRIAERTPSRGELGLPSEGFVFTCQNTVYKISPEVFDVWMRLLQAVEGSVLWLGIADRLPTGNLQREARARGVAPERIVFGSWVKGRADHLARLRVADLFLDTQPYNAHTTACDALWVGLPLLTRVGNTFPARIAASLLRAIDLPELVTESLAEYERTALMLALNPDKLASIRTRLARNREVAALFDTPRFTRNLEAAYITMWERHQAGSPPEHFAVDEPAPRSIGTSSRAPRAAGA